MHFVLHHSLKINKREDVCVCAAGANKLGRREKNRKIHKRSPAVYLATKTTLLHLLQNKTQWSVDVWKSLKARLPRSMFNLKHTLAPGMADSQTL